jgi:uncharacterized protein involved in exopolysaccharide biosynthesis
MFDEIAKPQRQRTVLEIAAAAPDVTVERFFNASAQLSDLVKRYELAYLSQAGIQPTTEPAAAAAPAQSARDRADERALAELLDQREALARELALVTEKFGDRHPQVIELRQMLEALNRRIVLLSDGAAPSTAPSP